MENQKRPAFTRKTVGKMGDLENVNMWDIGQKNKRHYDNDIYTIYFPCPKIKPPGNREQNHFLQTRAVQHAKHKPRENNKTFCTGC